MKRKASLALLMICIGAAFTSDGATAAEGTALATVSGVVSNEATRDFLSGAIIQVEGSAISTVTERGGGYHLALPPGNHTLVVSYAGLDETRVPISIESGTATVRNIALKSEIYKLDAFSVSGVREGNALAIQTQRMAENPKWVAATDTFGNPAANPGELIQRMPGISTDVVGGEVRSLYLRGMGTGFSALLVDGERMAASTGGASRDYQIEQLGTGNLESVELIKAPQPEQDANAVAGFVNLVSRRAFDASGRKITVTAGTLWRVRDGMSGSPYQDRPSELDLFNFAYSDVFSVLGKQKNLGVAFNFSRRRSSTTQDEGGANFIYNISAGILNPNTSNPLQRTWGTGDFGNPAIARNAGLSVDYKLTPDAYVFAKLSYNTNDQYQQALRAGFGNPAATVANFTPDSTYEHSFMLPHPGSIGELRSWPQFNKNARSYAVSGGTEFKLFDQSLIVSVRGNYSHADISYPGTILTRQVTPTTTGLGFEIDRRGQDEWYPIIRQTDGPSIYEGSSYNLATMTKNSNKAPNDIVGFRTDVTKKFVAPVPSSIKAGVKYTDDKRTAWIDSSNLTFVGQDGIANSADDVSTPYVDYSYKQNAGHYGPFPFVSNPAQIPEAYWKPTAADAYNSVVGSLASNTELQEKIAAGYIQGSLRLGKLRILGGLRVEQTETKATSWVRNTTAAWGGNSVNGTSLNPVDVAANAERAHRSFVRRNTGTGKYTDVFPGLHFVFEPLAGLLGRASYNRAISRPAVSSLLPTVTENLDAMTISMGNPNLKPYHTDNFDVSIEKYFEPIGLFSVGVFLKEISDYSRSVSSTVGTEGIDGSGTYAGFTLTTTEPAGSARVRGIEASYQQQLSFLPGALKGLGVQANFTYLQTQGNFGGTTVTNRLANLVPRSGNAGINYRYRGLDARLLFNWTGEKYRGTTAGIDQFDLDRLFVDLKLQYTLSRRYDVFLDVTNLTDEPVLTITTLSGIRWFKTTQGVLFTAGVRGRF
jgi:TonB-dependent receptor